jgi:serine/threonine protein kinase
MKELCCPTCGQRYAYPDKNCSKDGTLLVQFFPITRELSVTPTRDLSKTIQEVPTQGQSRPQHLSMNLAPGSNVGEYVLQRRLGVGGMGEVWKAHQPTIGKTVAIKVLTQESAKSKKSIARFIQEARAVNEIRHPNLVDIFSFGELPDQRPYFVMEFLDGKSLGEYMESTGPLPFSDMIHIFSQTCEVLQAAHDKGIVHRDLKPDNIYLISRQAEPLFVKVLDFGIAKLAGAGAQHLTDQGAVFGTPGYMSPEQYEETKDVDHRSDIYALGVLLFEMLTGRLPFHEPGLGMYELIVRQISQPPPKPSQVIVGRNIPEGVDTLILQMLAKTPTGRPSSCQEALRLFLQAAAPMKNEPRVEQVQAKPKSAGATTLELSSPLIESRALQEPDDLLPRDYSLESIPTIKHQKLSAELLSTPIIPMPDITQTLPEPISKPPKTSQTQIIVIIGGVVVLLSAVLTFLFMR